MSDPDRRRGTQTSGSCRSKAILWVAGLAMVAALVPSVVIEGDTTWLLAGTREILACLDRGQWSHCEGAHQWPLLQYLPALPLASLGVPLATIGDLLAYINIASFAGLLWVTWWCVTQRSAATAMLALIVLGSGELLYYANRTFGEMLAAFLGVCLVAACLRGHAPVWVALWAFLGSSSKESSFPFLALLGCASLLVRDPGTSVRVRFRAERARVAGLAAGLCLGAAAGAALNLFRFGVPYNVKYVHFATWSGPLSVQLEHLAALWVAPNVGFVFFWPLFVVVLAAVPICLLRERAPRRDWLPLGGPLLLLALLSGFLARWWASYGWWAWGSRLMMPWVPPVLLLLLWSHAGLLERGLARLLRGWAPGVAVLATAGVVTLGLPHLTSAFRTEQVITDTFIVPGVCPLPDTPASSVRHFDCVREAAWLNPSPLLLAYELSLDGRLLVPLLAYSILISAACLRLWRTTQSIGERVEARSGRHPSLTPSQGNRS